MMSIVPIPRGREAASRKAHNLKTLVRLQAPQPRKGNSYEFPTWLAPASHVTKPTPILVWVLFYVGPVVHCEAGHFTGQWSYVLCVSFGKPNR